ncbi:OVARIAN TUMOR DOMAIN-containing deubiquitinating enzyme 1 isoform X1 [Musa acuminata AAA Group]|uniref:OVARIAN TUMOR DOMAIN-containing deubiquitinating enzyme 1 isoform X1 n=1 Tax=Musa acuminata AAA Group TaxID=214697 RepID=UPI0031D5BBC2
MAQEAEAITNKRKAGNDFVGDGSGDGDCAEGDLPAMPEVPSLGVDPKSSAEAPGSYPDLVDVYIASLSDGRYGDSNNRFGYKNPCVGDKEPLSFLAAEIRSGDHILQEKIKLLNNKYAALRRIRGDGNCFYRSFMFSYLEQIVATQDKAEVDRILANVAMCRKTLQVLGDPDFMVDEFFFMFISLLENVLNESCPPISHEELLQISRDESFSDNLVLFFRIVASGEIRRRAAFFEPFIIGLENTSVDQFCKESVEMLGEESNHVQIVALSDALGVPISVEYLDQNSSDGGALTPSDVVTNGSNPSRTFLSSTPRVKLLCHLGHYDVLYPKCQ